MTEQHPTDYLFQQHAEQKSTRPPTDQQHPITPSQELFNQWFKSCPCVAAPRVVKWIATQAAEWGWQQRDATVPQELQERADQELEACCEYIHGEVEMSLYNGLRAARRPKPPISKEQALESLAAIENMSDQYVQFEQDIDIIRRALKSIPEKDNNRPERATHD